MLSAHPVEPLPLSDRHPFPPSSPRLPAQPLDVAMDRLPSPSHDDASTTSTSPQLPSTELSTSGQVVSFLSTFRPFSQPHLINSFPGSLKTFLQDVLSLKACGYSLSAGLPYIRAPHHDFQARVQFSPSLHTFTVRLPRRAKRSRFHPIIRALRCQATSTNPRDQSSQTFLRATWGP
jgi:hypothetical protein